MNLEINKTGNSILGIPEYSYEGLRFLYRPGSEKCIVTFSAFAPKDFIQKYNYMRDFINTQYTIFAFIDTDEPNDDPRGTYYLDSDYGDTYLEKMNKVITFLLGDDLDKRNTWLIGSSKGGVGALLLGLVFEYTNIMIMAPQARIAKNIKKRSAIIIKHMTGGDESLYQKLDKSLFTRIKQCNSTAPWDIRILCGKDDAYHIPEVDLLEKSFFVKGIEINRITINGAHDNTAIKEYRDYLKKHLVDVQRIKSSKHIKPHFSFANTIRFQGLYASRLARQKKPYASYILDNKASGYSFAEKCGVNYADIYFENEVLDECINKLNFPCVFKPTSENNAKGVYICYEPDNIIYLNTGKKISSIDELMTSCEQMLLKGVIKKNSWMAEKLILADKESDDIARDIKFYMFYGRIGLILETIRVPKIQRCWYDENLQVVDTGKYADLLFESKKIPEKLINIAKELSLKVPVPFLRVDFLVTGEDYYLGEFTPAPGQYWTFNYKWDSLLGHYYNEASMNLLNDIAYGKDFLEYKEFRTQELIS